MKYDIDFIQKVGATAGPKAREDASRVLNNTGYKTIRFICSQEKPFGTIFSVFSCLWRVAIGSKVLLQYPLGNEKVSALLLILLRVKRCSITLLIHDIVSIRSAGKLSRIEQFALSCGTHIIVHTEKMKDALASFLLSKPVFSVHILHMFDYFVDSPISRIADERGNSVIFAGNLDKSVFIEKLKESDACYFLYGQYSGHTEMGGNMIYKGIFQPSDLSRLEGSWGLVWDGDSLDTCSGQMGWYLKINAPHKLSLYLAARIPVIVWDQSAVSDYVTCNHLGISVSNIRNLNEVLEKVSDDEYALMKENVSKVSERIIRGDMLKKVLAEIDMN